MVVILGLGSVLNVSCMKTLVTLSGCLRLPDLESFFEGHYRHSPGVIFSWKTLVKISFL